MTLERFRSSLQPASRSLRVEVEPMPLDQANDALERLRNGALRGAAVLIP